MSTPTIRAKIDEMVKRAIVKNLFVSEAGPAGVRNDPKNIYASEDYTSIWDALPETRPNDNPDEPSVSATQADFKRWFIRNYLESNTSPLRLEPEERDQLLAAFEAMDPNQMVEWINANPNELFSFSPYQGDDMALVKILGAYVNSKGVRQRIAAQAGSIDQMANGTAEDMKAPEKSTSGRMTQDDSEITLDTVKGLVSSDATENLSSRQAIDYRIKAAMGKLGSSQEVKMVVQFLFNKNRDEQSQSTVMEMIDELMDKVLEATAEYTDMFVDSMFEAFGSVGFPEENENESETAYNQQAALSTAISEIAPGASSKDIAIFKKALGADMGNGMTVHEMILNSSASDPGVKSAIIKAVMEVFETNTLDMEAQFYADPAQDGDVLFEQFVAKFVDAMFDAFTEEGPELQQAFAEGITDFSAKLQSAGVKKPIGSQELGVFESILLSDVDGVRRIVDIFLQGDADDAAAYDEVWEASFEKFKSELDKQTLFNSLGDYIDTRPEVANLRHSVFNTAKAVREAD